MSFGACNGSWAAVGLLALTESVSASVFADRFEHACLAVQGGSDALAWQADSLQQGEILTLTTNGHCGFGELGPELIILMDLAGMTDGDIDIDSIVICEECELEGGASHEVASVAEMPGGKGLVMGGIGDSLNPTSTPRFRLTHPPYSRGFDSRMTYWPESHQLNAMDYLLGNVAGYDGNPAWQIKPIWKMSDGNFGGSDTDFFLTGGYAWYGPGEYFKNSAVISSNSVGTYYLPRDGGEFLRPRSEYSLPYPEPYVLEYGWDQGSLTEAFDAFVDVQISTVEQGSMFRHREDDIRLHVVDGPTKIVNHFTYPGYIRGFSRTLGLNFYEAELYKTGGPGAFARVAITDHPDYFQAKRRTLLEPIFWSNGEVRLRLREGWFDLSDPQGLYFSVINADNEQVASIAL